jgi:hypothetical protein
MVVIRAIRIILGVVLAELAVSASDLPVFRLELVEVAAPEGGRVTSQVLVTPTHRFGLKFPARWAVQMVSSNQTLMMFEPDLRAGIQLRFWPQESQTPEELESWLRQRLEERQEDEVMVGQFRTRSATAEGWGFDLVRSVDRKTRAGLRVIVVPYPGGLAEFELRAPAAEVADYHRVLRHLVASFSPEVVTKERTQARVPAPGP